MTVWIIKETLYFRSSKMEPQSYNTDRDSARKSFVICATQLPGGLLFKKLKYFEVMLNIFEFLQV